MHVTIENIIAERDKLGDHSEGNAQPAGHLGQAKEASKALAQTDVPGALVGLQETSAPAIEEHHPHHQAKQQKPQVRILTYLGEQHRDSFPRASYGHWKFYPIPGFGGDGTAGSL
jgi:hypothetical protein